ncbi:IS66 family insertion sequence element accessory protein TnpA [Paraburkholderia graminis]|uniref:IS66 family insertion sequence element accessory protein TnpA n=1 Tax=Paraburkholderia graminis TaxID=60548 RepID=UPI000402214E
MDDDAVGGAAVRMRARRPRQGEAFWREMVAAWKISGVGTRRFCREQGLAISTFGLWRKKFAGETPSTSPLAVTADAALVIARLEGEPAATPSSASADTPTSSTRDRVTLSIAGVRIELSGVHAERIVRFVLGQLGGARC